MTIRARACSLLCLAAAGLAAPGCGKKGPPLAPLARVPGRADGHRGPPRPATRWRSRSPIPRPTSTRRKPADIARVDVYAYTAHGAERRARPAAHDAGRAAFRCGSRSSRSAEDADERRSPARRRRAEPGEDQGAVVTVTETLTAEMLVPLAPDRRSAPVPRAGRAGVAGSASPLGRAPLAGPRPGAPRRGASTWSTASAADGDRGAASPRPSVPPRPRRRPPPLQPRLEATEDGVAVRLGPCRRARACRTRSAAEGGVAATPSPRGMESAPHAGVRGVPAPAAGRPGPAHRRSRVAGAARSPTPASRSASSAATTSAR